MKGLYILLFGCFILNLFSCINHDKFDENYYSEKNFIALKTIINNHQIDVTVKPLVLLFIRDIECHPCLQELEYWNKNEKNFKNWDIKLFVVSKYHNKATYFI